MKLKALYTKTERAENFIRFEFIHHLAEFTSKRSYLGSTTLVNTIDLSSPPLTFRFTLDYVYGKDVEPPDLETMEGCTSCRPNMGQFCGCEYTAKCECLEYAEVNRSKLTESQEKKLKVIESVGGSTLGFPKRFPYSQRTGLLVDAYLTSRFPIYECNERCACGRICKTRVVQKGRKVSLQIFKTQNRGWGLRSPEALARGQYVDTYYGEVITTKEADERHDKGDKGKESYLFRLDKFEDYATAFEVDGEFVGGPSRFINHSCEPNCRQFVVSWNKNNPLLYSLAFFACRDIEPNEELTFDYLDLDQVDEEKAQQGIEEDSIPCLCGASNCRKWLWK
jgi:[histone H3]-lysine9 N-trimethyltransferase SUV39H